MSPLSVLTPYAGFSAYHFRTLVYIWYIRKQLEPIRLYGPIQVRFFHVFRDTSNFSKQADFQGGSTEIDRRFYAVVSKDHIKGFGELRCYETSPTSILMRSFEKAKRRFQGTVDASLQNLAYRRRGNKCSFQFTRSV